MTIVTLHVLDVGQGMGHYIEVREGTTLTHTVLADLGSDAKREAAGWPSVDKLVNALKVLAQPAIDVLFISHSDRDHHNLLSALLDRFKPYNGTTSNDSLYIKRVIYGGAPGATAMFKKILNRLKDYMHGDRPEPVADNFSSFDTQIDLVEPIETFGNLDVYVITGNLTKPSSLVSGKRMAKDIARNTVSLMLLFSLRKSYPEATKVGFVIAGDATAHTIAECNEFMTLDAKQKFFRDIFVLTAPHHGSYRTLLDLNDFRSDEGWDMEKTAKEFVAHMRARCVVASAEEHGHHHPSLQVLMLFWPYLLKEPLWSEEKIPGYHLLTAYITADLLKTAAGAWPSAEAYYSIWAKANIYSNLYSFQEREPYVLSPDIMAAGPKEPKNFDPPTGVAWIFLLSDIGTPQVMRWTNRLDLADLPRFALDPPPAGQPPAAVLGVVAPPVVAPKPTGAFTRRPVQVFP